MEMFASKDFTVANLMGPRLLDPNINHALLILGESPKSRK